MWNLLNSVFIGKIFLLFLLIKMSFFKYDILGSDCLRIEVDDGVKLILFSKRFFRVIWLILIISFFIFVVKYDVRVRFRWKMLVNFGSRVVSFFVFDVIRWYWLLCIELICNVYLFGFGIDFKIL